MNTSPLSSVVQYDSVIVTLPVLYFTSPAPTAPRLLRVVDSSSCQLDWLPPGQPNGAVTYTVQYQTSGSFMDLTTGLTTTHHSAVNLISGTNVTVRVQAVNTAGTSTSNTTVLQGLYVRHDCMYMLYIYLCHIIASSCILLCSYDYLTN